MKKMLVKSVALAGGIMLLSTPIAGLSASAAPQERINPRADLIQLGSGGIAVPGFEAPKNGIIGGLAGCLPDVQNYYKGEADEHIVFSASVTSQQMSTSALKTLINREFITVYAEIYSDGEMIAEVPFEDHGSPDPNTNKDFLVTCFFINDPSNNLPSGDYTYKFKAKAGSKFGQGVPNVLAEWEPDDNTFTIIDGPMPNRPEH